jgi:steroid 5-alpha reductase family enzyme
MGDLLDSQQELEPTINPELQQQPQVEPASLGIIIIGAIAAAAIGAVVWALIVYYGNYEIGILASGIGALVGITVAYLAKKNVEQQHQIVAVIFGLLGVIAGKYLSFYLFVKKAEDELGQDLLGYVKFSDTFQAIDILWIVLAVAAAWTIPKKYAERP